MSRVTEIEAVYDLIKTGPTTLGIRSDGVGVISLIHIPSDGNDPVHFVPLAEIHVPMGAAVDE